MTGVFTYSDGKEMALESMASLSDLLSSLLSSKPPSPSILKPMTLPTSVPARSSLQHLSMTTKILTAGNDDVTNRVAYPSLANANLVFFKSGYYNVEVVPKEGESEEQLVNDFKRSCFRAGVLQESRRRRFFESSQEKKKRKTKEAAKKYRKRRPNPKTKPQSTPETHKSRNVSREDEEDDHWELPPDDIEIPYTNRS
ncbi:30S ribosomal protein S21, chloroplastic [Capsella rubella]|uniref:30S ribosomal protein S21, chloroplastic n=1 Tax=Capsella rubella TaxID=81985 RepID=UPI000CD5A6D8|nr:30S ribosomal protein S21, chloroplastic [Capsella rubella]